MSIEVLLNDEIKKVVNIDSIEDLEFYEPILGGLSGSEVYRIKTKEGGDFVLKFVSVKSHAERELPMQTFAGDHDLAPKVIYKCHHQDLIVMPYVAPERLPDDLSRVDYLVDFLHKMHAVDISTAKNSGVVLENISPYDFLKEQLGAIKKSALLTDDILIKFDELIAAEKTAKPRKVTFSHNDINPGNVVFSENKVRAFDWTTAGLNDSFYDVASISYWFFRNKDVEKRLLEVYLGYEPSSDELKHFELMQKLAKAVPAAGLINQAVVGGVTKGDLPEEFPTLDEFLHGLGSGHIDLDSLGSIYTFGMALMQSF